MNVNRRKLAGTLRKAFPFNDLEEEHVDLFLDNAEIVFFPAEKMVYLEGTPALFFYIIYQGQVEIMKEKHHALFQLNNLREGFSFGEDALTKSQKRRTSARAITDVILMKISKEILSQVGMRNTTFWNNINTMITSYDYLVCKTINLGKDETVCYIGQPHPIIVVLKMIFALLAVFGLNILLIILFNSGLLTYRVLLWSGGMLTVSALVWIGWRYDEP